MGAGFFGLVRSVGPLGVVFDAGLHETRRDVLSRRDISEQRFN